MPSTPLSIIMAAPQQPAISMYSPIPLLLHSEPPRAHSSAIVTNVAPKLRLSLSSDTILFRKLFHTLAIAPPAS